MTKNEWKKKQQELIQLKLCVCYLCGRLIEKNSELSLDHVIPRSRGGEDVPENWGASHRACNWVKGALTYQEFIRWRILERRRNGGK